MSGGYDPRVVQAVRRRALELGLATHVDSRPTGVPKLARCLFSQGCFHLVFENLDTRDLRGDRVETDGLDVVACKVDEFQRGVDVVLAGGSLTSFSAEFAWFGSDRGRARISEDDKALSKRAARRVRELRESRGWSVTELARRAGMEAPNVHRFESARHVPSTATLLKLAASLKVPLSRLIRRDEKET